MFKKGSRLVLVLGLVFVFVISGLVKCQDEGAVEGDDNVDDFENFDDVHHEDDEAPLVDEKEDFERQVNQTMKEIGIEEAETIDRDTFKLLFRKVLIQDEELGVQEMDLFNKLIERVVLAAPETFPRSELFNYLDMEEISRHLHEAMADEGYDPDAVFDEPEGEVESVEEEMEAKDDL